MHEEWINTVKPAFHPVVSVQLHDNFEVSDVDIENCKSVRNEMRAAINSLLKVMIVDNLVHLANITFQLDMLLILSKKYC